MRNTGWYIPFWRRPKKKGRSDKPGSEDITRTDEQLEAVRQRWIERYRRTTRALRVLGLSIGSNRAEVQARYDHLRGGLTNQHELDEAYRFLMRVLPAQERRRKRLARGSGAPAAAAERAAAESGAPPETDRETNEDDEGTSEGREDRASEDATALDGVVVESIEAVSVTWTATAGHPEAEHDGELPDDRDHEAGDDRAPPAQ